MSPAVPDSRRTRRGDRSRGEIIKEGDMKPAFDDRESRCREDRIEEEPSSWIVKESFQRS